MRGRMLLPVKRIYFDNAATTKVDKGVIKAMLPYFNKKFGNASSLHSFGNEARKAVEDSRKTIAEKLNALPEEIIFTSGGTESDNLAIKGFAYANKDKGNHIITSKVEHHAVLNVCKFLESQGFEVTYLNVNSEGIIDLEEFKKAITEKTILVTIMHANNEIGTIQPIEEIGKICRQKGIAFHTDAVQSFTKISIDVKKMNIDLMSISGHKIYGPKGVGALYIRKGLKIEAQNIGGGHEFNLRSGTENVAGIVGFAKAASLNPEVEKVKELRDYLIDLVLKKIPKSRLNGSKEKRLCNNANFSIAGIEGESILMRLDEKGIAVSTGSACSSKSLEPSHVLLAIGLKHVEAHGSLRVTLSRENTKEEIDYFVKCLEKVVKELREVSPEWQ